MLGVTDKIGQAYSLAILCLCLLAGSGGAGFAANPGGKDYDSGFVDMVVPDRVLAHEVFPVTITMRNTGTQAWEGWPVRLRSVHPPNNRTWGTDYILIAQGTAVKAGETYAFRSYLKAPATAGKVNFQWQVCRDGESWFGEVTPGRGIDVVASPATASKASVPKESVPAGKKVLAFDDFEYLGSFKPPKIVLDARGAFSESGLALRPMADGRDRLWMNYTHPTQVLFEIEIPEPVKIQDGEHADLKTAEVKQVWGALNIPQSREQNFRPNGGFVWIEQRQTLFWTWYHGYKTGDAPPVLGATKLANDGAMTHFGPWHVAAPSGLYKAYWGGVTALPKAFADQYTDGKTLALGFGGYYSICAPASRGPALGAIPDPIEGQTAVHVTEMLCHPHDSPAARDGDYFNANCGFWNDQPAGPEQGTWTYDDWCRAGTFVETDAGHAYVAFVRLGTGRLGYDFGTITSAGAAESWYCYDPQDLGAAARGRKPPWQVVPRSVTRVQYPLGRTVTGACFDARSGRLYLCLSWAYPDGRESFPVIHVYAGHDAKR
jgi:hypothetical protein